MKQDLFGVAYLEGLVCGGTYVPTNANITILILF